MLAFLCTRASAWNSNSKLLCREANFITLRLSSSQRFSSCRKLYLHTSTSRNCAYISVQTKGLTSRLTELNTFLNRISTYSKKMSSSHSDNGMKQRMVWVDLESGLTQAVRNSKITLQQAEYEFLSFIRQHTPPGQCPLAGNSVHADKKFLDKYMPQFMHHLHYRIIDVSTIKELCRRWFPEEYKLAPQKKASHRALDDIQESIKELHFYRAHVFKSQAEEKKRKLLQNGDRNKCV
uniref:Exonuclease domain-containing protein n=1 Tax=Esox lucius TaxID=8010 RepID=A0A3P9AG84_ESOLU